MNLWRRSVQRYVLDVTRSHVSLVLFEHSWTFHVDSETSIEIIEGKTCGANNAILYIYFDIIMFFQLLAMIIQKFEH